MEREQQQQQQNQQLENQVSPPGPGGSTPPPAQQQAAAAAPAAQGQPQTPVVGPRCAPTNSVVNAIIEKKEDGPGPKCGHTPTAVAAVGKEGTPGYIGPRLILFGGATALEGNSAASGAPSSAGSSGIKMGSIRRIIVRQGARESSSSDPARKRLRGIDTAAGHAQAPASIPHAPTPPPPRQVTPPPSEPRDASRGKEKAPSHFRRTSSSSGQSLSEERADCNITLPHRKNRRHLYIESAMRNKPILPKMGPPDKGSYHVDGGYTMKGSEFQVYPGVRDNDTLETPGAASQLGCATIFPRDEHLLFRKFLKEEDLVDQEVMRIAQRTIVNNAQHRAYRDWADKEIHTLRDKVMELTNANNQLSGLPGVVRDLEKQLSKALQDLNLAKGDLTVEISRSNKLSEDLQQSQIDMGNLRSEYDSLFTNFNEITDRNQELERLITELKSRPSSSLGQADIDRIRAEAVREYRLSKDCLRRKEDYSVVYAKYGFYLARSWLEKHREGEEFPELQYTREAKMYEAPDWTIYELDAMSTEEFLKKVTQDDLENLTGPWQPLSPDNAPESIGAFDELDGEDPSMSDPQASKHVDAD